LLAGEGGNDRVDSKILYNYDPSILKVVYTRAREEEQQRHDRAEKIIRLENATREGVNLSNSTP